MKKISLLFIMFVMFVSLAQFSFADKISSIDSYYSMEELETITHNVKQLVKEGKQNEAANLPIVKELKSYMEANPEIAKEYFLSLEAVKAMRKNLEISVNENESKIIEFEDGSFIHVTANTTQFVSPTRDPGGLIYKATDVFTYTIWGAYPAAICELYTDYEYGNYYLNIIDCNATQTAYWPAWTLGCSATVVSGTRTKGIFNFRDTLGSFGAILITDITAGPFCVDVDHTVLK
ncbi:MAG: hypothetical protein PHC69_04815 [Ruminiclostridium sp.]|nr:hypothetical protein [Ruminiclostridium sp.]